MDETIEEKKSPDESIMKAAVLIKFMLIMTLYNDGLANLIQFRVTYGEKAISFKYSTVIITIEAQLKDSRLHANHSAYWYITASHSECSRGSCDVVYCWWRSL